MLSVLVTLIILVAVCGIGWWVVQQVPLPEPLRIVCVVIIALVAIVLLLSLVPGVGGLRIWRGC